MMKRSMNNYDFINKCIHIADYERSNGRINLCSELFLDHRSVFYSKYKKNCIVMKRVFKISKNQFNKIKKNKCYLCGKNNKNHKNGIDRINNNLGYIMGNLISCCGDCNNMKKDYEYNKFINKCNQIKYFNIQKYLM